VLWAQLADALAQAPDLSGARCAGRWDLFDVQYGEQPARGEREQRALALCRECPLLDACRAYFEGLSAADRLWGVIAGMLRRPLH
jgi:Transcription factor WhiB